MAIGTLMSSCNGQDTPTSLGNPVAELPRGTMIIFQDRNDNYWFGSGEGVFSYDGQHLTQFTTEHGLCNNRIRDIQEDAHGYLYFDTGAGVSKFDPEVSPGQGQQSFTTLQVIGSDDPRNTWTLDPDDLWFAGNWNENGPYRYDGKSLYHLKFPKHPLEDIFNARYPNASYSPYEVYSIYRDTAGDLWFGTAILGVCRFDGALLEWISEEELTELDDGPAPGMRSIIEDQDGHFWFSHMGYRYQLSQGEAAGQQTGEIGFHRLPGPKLPAAFRGDFMYFMSAVNDLDGNLWMVTYDSGVWRYDGNQLQHYPITRNGRVVTLFSVYLDKQGTLWLGTHDAGPYRFNGQHFEPFKVSVKD